MIKDRVFQKRIKGKVLAMAMTAVMTSLFVPIVGNAADDIPTAVKFDQKIDNASFTATSTDITTGSSCWGKNGCTGHWIDGSVTKGTNGVTIRNGHHYIKLSGANIESSASVLNVLSGAEVTLVLEGDNTLKSGEAGIYVAQDATLNVMEVEGTPGKLTAASVGEGAGIGGYGIGDASTAGTINIESGTIIAQGGDRSAGIGGSDRGAVQNVKIDGGCVVAKGGDGKDPSDGTDVELDNETIDRGSPGIGPGNASTGGAIVINGGQVTAIGGTHWDEDGTTEHASGISGNSLTSMAGGNTVIVSDEITTTFTTVNGLVWDLKRNDKGQLVDKNSNAITDFLQVSVVDGIANIKHGNTCTVYGNAEMPKNFPADFNNTQNGEKNILKIPNGATFKVPAELKDGFPFEGILITEANSTIVNPEQIHFQPGSRRSEDKDTKYELSFNPEKDLTMKEGPFIYKGVAYQTEPITDNELFTVATRRDVLIGQDRVNCRVDTSGLKCVYSWDNNNGTKPKPDIESGSVVVKNAGNYTATFTYGTKDVEKPFTIEELDISNSSAFTVDKIPDKEYKNAEFEQNDFMGEVVARLNNVELSAGSDYTWSTEGDKEVTDTAKLIIAGKNNFKGNRTVYFRITPLTVNTENTIVELSNPADWTLEDDGRWSTTYNGHQHMPEIKSVSVKTSENEVITLSGGSYDSILKASEYTEKSHYTDSGTITLSITPKASNKNFTGECTKEFIIKPKQIEVISVTPMDTERPYNGAANVKVTDIEVDLKSEVNDRNIEDGDGTEDRPIQIPDSVEAIIAENNVRLDIASVKTPTNAPYTQVWIDEDVCLNGEGGRNYSIGGRFYSVSENPDDTFRLTEGILVTPRQAPTIVEVTGTPEAGEDNPPRFNCSLDIKVKEGDTLDPESRIYLYRCGEGEEEPPEDLGLWQETTLDSMAYSNLSPNQSLNLYVMIGGTSNVAGTKTPFPCAISVPKYPRKEGPSECTLEASETPNEDGETYKLTVSPAQVINDTYPEGQYLYSLSEEGPYIGGDPSVLLDSVEPKSTYTVYVKYAETDQYTESEVGTPTNSVTTGEGEAQQPTVSCGGTTRSDGEIHFSGTASVSIEYAGGLQDYEIRYTTDGTRPTASSTLYEGPFEVSADTTINAFVIKSGVASSEVTTVKLVRDGNSNNPGGDQPGATEDIIPVVKALDENTIKSSPLGGTEFNTMDAVTQQMASKILLKKGYSNSQMIYCDLTVQIRRENGQYTDATEEDFAKAGTRGIRVGLAFDGLRALGLPAEVNGEKYNFAVSHMFSTDIPRLGVTAGQTEEPTVSKTADGKGIAFYVTGTSPLAIAWADIANSDPNDVEDPNNPNNPDDPNNPDNPNNPDDPNNPTNPDDQNNNQPGDGTQNGSNGTTSQTDAATQGGSDSTQSALSNIMPKTGDPLSFVPWIAAAVISIGVITGIMKKKSGKKNTDKKKKTTAKKTTKKKK